MPVLEQQTEDIIAIVADALQEPSLDATFRRILHLAVETSEATAGSLAVRLGRGAEWRELHEGFLDSDRPGAFVDSGMARLAIEQGTTQYGQRGAKSAISAPRIRRMYAELALPVVADSEVVIIDLLRERRGFSLEQRRAAEALTKLAGALARAWVREAAKGTQAARRLSQAETAAAAGLGISGSAWDLDKFAGDVLERAMNATRANVAQLWIRDHAKGQLVLRKAVGQSGPSEGAQLELGANALVALAARTGERQPAHDVEDPYWRAKHWAGTPGTRAELAEPILHAGSCIGVLNVQSATPSAFGGADERLVAYLAARCAGAIVTDLLIQVFAKISRALLSATEFREYLDAVYEAGASLFPDSLFVVLLLSDSGRSLTIARGRAHPSTEGWKPLESVPVGKGVTGKAVGRALRAKRPSYEPFCVPDVRAVKEGEDYITLLPEVRSSVGTALVSGTDVLGAIAVENRKPDAFSAQDRRLMKVLADSVATSVRILEQARALERAKQLELGNARWSVLGQLADNLVHRINNELGLARLAVAELLRDDRLPADTLAELQSVQGNVQAILEQARALTKPLAREPSAEIDPIEVLQTVETRVKPKVPDRIRLSVEWEASLPQILAPAALADHFEELVTNAMKAMSRRGSRAEVRARKLDGKVRFEFWNDGPPVPPAEREKIFDLFFRGETAKETQGTGFGLWLIRTDLERCGGTISLEYTNSRQGTLFAVDCVESGTLEAREALAVTSNGQ